MTGIPRRQWDRCELDPVPAPRARGRGSRTTERRTWEPRLGEVARPGACRQEVTSEMSLMSKARWMFQGEESLYKIFEAASARKLGWLEH